MLMVLAARQTQFKSTCATFYRPLTHTTQAAARVSLSLCLLLLLNQDYQAASDSISRLIKVAAAAAAAAVGCRTIFAVGVSLI